MCRQKYAKYLRLIAFEKNFSGFRVHHARYNINDQMFSGEALY